jgi:hypothetical protein
MGKTNMKKTNKGILDKYVRSFEEKLQFSWELTLGQLALEFSHILQKSQLSKTELSKLSGVSVRSISRVLDAEVVSLKTIVRLARAINYITKIGFKPLQNSHKRKLWKA